MSALYPNRNAGLCGTTCGPSMTGLLDEDSAKGAHESFERIPNFVYVAICRARTRDPLASNPRCNCFTPAKAHVVGGLAFGAFGRIAPDLNRIISFHQKTQ